MAGDSENAPPALRPRSQKWPRGDDPDNRLYPHCTPDIAPKFRFGKQTRFFAIGSCFARNIEEYLARLNLQVPSREISFPQSEVNLDSRVNDLIVKYTPPSILAELADAFDDTRADPALDAGLVEVGPDEWYDLNLPGFYPGVTRARALQRRREVRDYFRRIREADVVVMTLGLIEAWKDEETGAFICNLPARRVVQKYPRRFSLRVLDYEECLACVREILDRLHGVAPQAKVILTTSPVPMVRTFTGADVVVANAYSKSVLRAVCGAAARLPQVDYFPSYEMVIYSQFASTWDDDQRHVTDARVGRIVRHFARHYIPDYAAPGETEADPGLMRQTYADARIELSSGNYELALAKLRQVREHLEDDPAFLADFCLALEKTSHWREAIEAHEELHRQGDRNLARMERMANALAYLGEHSAALRVADELLAIAPAHVAARLIKIDALIALRDHEPALALATRLARDDLFVANPYTQEPQHHPWWFYWRLSQSLTALNCPDLAAQVAAVPERPAPGVAA